MALHRAHPRGRNHHHRPLNRIVYQTKSAHEDEKSTSPPPDKKAKQITLTNQGNYRQTLATFTRFSKSHQIKTAWQREAQCTQTRDERKAAPPPDPGKLTHEAQWQTAQSPPKHQTKNQT